MTQFEVLDLLRKSWPKWMTTQQIANAMDNGKCSTTTIMRKLRHYKLCEAKSISEQRMIYAYRHKPNRR